MNLGMQGRALAVAIVVALCTATVLVGCPTTDLAEQPASAAATASDAGESGERRDAAPWQEPEPVRPEGLPEGWVRWDGAGKMCNFWVPSGPENMPPPLRWVDCPRGGSLPDTAVCRSIEVDWPSPANDSGGLSPWMHRGVDGDGTVRFAIGRKVGGFHRREIMRDDGHIEHAILQGDVYACGIGPTDSRGRRYGYGFQGNTEGSGILSGEATSPLPDHVLRWSQTESHAPHLTAFGVLDLAPPGHTLMLFPPGTSADAGTRIWSSAQDNGLQQRLVTATDDAIFWKAANEIYGKQRLYTPDAGVLALRDFGTDYTRRDFDLGTDGHDLVWIYGSERAQPSGTFPKLEVFTAPYTTSPDALAPRRLGSYGASVGVRPFVVGCGFGLHNGVVSSTLVRLSDGQTWKIPAANVQMGSQWSWGVAVTCEELFGVAYLPETGARTLVRVRIGSLGPGTPAD